MDIGKFHVVIVHFPIALALVAVLADIIFVITKKMSFKDTSLYCLVLAAISAIPTVLTGLDRLKSMQPTLSADMLHIAILHRNFALTSLVLLIAASTLRLSQGKTFQKVWLVVYIILIIAIAGFISATGDYGGVLTHGPDYFSK